MATVGYIRVSTDKQNYDGQKLSILSYANDHLKGRVSTTTIESKPHFEFSSLFVDSPNASE